MRDRNVGDMERGGVFSRIQNIVEGMGYECPGCEITFEYGRKILRVYIDSIGGISAGDCEKVSRRINPFLDESDFPLDDRYFLEVSSPGLDRPLFSLKDFEKYKGRKVRIRFSEKVKGSRNMTVTILSAENSEVYCEGEDGELFITPYEKIARANLVIDPEIPKRRPKNK